MAAMGEVSLEEKELEEMPMEVGVGGEGLGR